jgi:3',5'-cyclic AMP phosphodiesterase CpdA
MAAVRVAALYDVHGNAPALEAVLADVERTEVDAIVFGGDLVWGAWPREALELARGVDEARFVMGNTDHGSLTDDEPSALWVEERLSDDERAFVLSWPAPLSLDGVLDCCATPRSETEVITPTSPESRGAEVLARVVEETVVCGHIHLHAIDLRTTDYDTRATAAAWGATGYPRTEFADELLAPTCCEVHLRRLS